MDVTVANAELGTLTGSDGADVLAGAGDGVTGAATLLDLSMSGDGGNDAVTAGHGERRPRHAAGL